MKTNKTAKNDNEKRGPGEASRQPGTKAAVPEVARISGSQGQQGATDNPSDEIDRIATMTVGELQALYTEVTGEKTRCPNRAWLILLPTACPCRSCRRPSSLK